MAFFKDLGDTLTKTGLEVMQKTKDTAEVMKLKSQISDEEKRIENLYREIGKAYFEAYADSGKDEFAGLVDSVKEANANIKDYSEQIIKLKGVVNCPKCGTKVAYNATFCSGCGFKMDTELPPENANKFCTGCGEKLAPNVAFCTKCGTKVE